MKAKEFAKMTKEELKNKLEELNKELVKQNAQRASGTSLKNPGMLRTTKRNIARILTMQNKK